ncbi:F-actin-capping protein subunit alpha [Chiua virens]|nr:F-actin-capping protein subunit alpha [Chiua virens]
MADSDDRIQVASAFVLQSPPGEINDVLNDIRGIVNDDGILEDGLLPAIREYNLAQFIIVDVPDANHQVTSHPPPSEGGEQERFLDPRSKSSFIFHHIKLASTLDPRYNFFSAALESAALSYLAAHYIEGVVVVFASQPPSQFTVQIASNKYNPSNFWSGRWRSQYQIDLGASKTITGKILVNVHYYEQGNVQLETSHDLSIPIPPAIVNASPNAAC